MMRNDLIFGNPIDQKTLKKAEKSKAKYLKKYGDDSNEDYYYEFKPIESLEELDLTNIVLSKEKNELQFDPKAVIIGNIRMGFGHYRISIAMASAAKALGYKPYWLDLASLDCTGSKMIQEQNNMYSLASKISQKSKLFNAIVWEPLNSEGFKKITYNAKDQKNSEILAPIYKHIDKEIPYIATHVWPSQAAVHGGMENVVNAIPDNWPMGLHLSEGALHLVQTPYAYLGYKTLNKFAKKPLKGMPEKDLKMVGRYIDHELLVNLEEDNQRRIERIRNDKTLRILITVGGAGAGFKSFLNIFNHLKPYIDQKRVALFVNFGDHIDVYEKTCKKLAWFKEANTFINQYKELKEFAKKAYDEEVSGLYVIENNNIFEAVYSTNLLMNSSDLLITKPSELAYYPIPKLFMKHIGGHEVYGAINGREVGDSVYECAKDKDMNEMIDTILADKELLIHIINQITNLKNEGYYDGAYNAVKEAVRRKVNNTYERLFNVQIEKEYVAPARVNLIGEHIDYNGGYVLPFAIDLKITGYVSKREDSLVKLYSLNKETVEEFDLEKEILPDHSWASYPKGMFKTIMNMGHKLGHGLNILYDSNIPLGSGLSSSAAILVLTGQIINKEYNLNLSKKEIALIAQKSENNFNGVHCGIMDQFAIALSSKNSAIMLNCSNQEIQNVSLDFGPYDLVLMNTKYQRKLTDSKYNERKAECDLIEKKLSQMLNGKPLCSLSSSDLKEALSLLGENEKLKRRLTHIVKENERVMLFKVAMEKHDYLSMGKLLNESDESLKNNYEVTGFALDNMTEIARSFKGTLGARMTGAGMGGFAIALVEKDKVNEFIKYVKAEYEQKTGLKADLFMVKSVDGAH